MINLYKSFIKKYLRLLISYLIICSLIFSNTAILLAQNITQQDKGINIDYSQHNPFINGDTPTMGPQSNGVDVINISKPTAEGVSHNKFTDFNVNENGLIINNLNFQQYSGNAQSVLSGQHVEFNRNFGTGNAAKIILSEVTGTDISTLKGYTEIYGQQADYIIANPNGITCIGCGFINVNRLSIIAGSSNIENGEIKTFDLSPNAMIKIEGIGDNDFGMNISGSPADIVASAIKIKGNIYSDNTINLLTGNNSYNFKTKEVSSNDSTTNNNIDIAVDSSAIGGVYAGKIKVYTSQKGLGVNIDGDLVSNLDDIEITSDGDIQYKQAVSNNNIKIKSESGSITQKDKANYAKNSITLEANKDINLDSDYIYTQNVNIKSDNDINANTKLIADNDINLIAKNNILNSDQILSGNEILLISGNEILNKGEINNQGKNLTLISENNITNASTIMASGLLNISAKNNLENQSLISSSDEGYFYANNLKNYGKIKSANNLTFDILNDLINYKNSGILSGKGILFKTGNNLINYRSEIYANEDITFMGQDGQYKKGPDPILSGDLEEIYKNPFIENIPDKEITDRPIQQIGDNNTDTILKLSTGYDLILDPDLIPEDGYELGKSYKTKDGYTIIIGKEIIKGDEITYEDNTQLTVKDLDGNTISYTFDEDLNIDLPETNISYVKDTIVNNDKLNEYKSDIQLEDKARLNNLVNINGRIESRGNINIFANNLINKSFNINTLNKARDLIEIKYKAGRYFTDWKKIREFKIGDTYLDSLSSKIISGKDLKIKSDTVLNESSELSSKQNIIIDTSELINKTYYEVVSLVANFVKKGFYSGRYKVRYRNDFTEQLVYSKTGSLITSGNNLIINADNIKNDQAVEVKLDVQDKPNIKINTGIIEVDISLPENNNGLFRNGNENSRYLITSDPTILSPDPFIGSNYFFSKQDQHISQEIKFLGDPAYENRLIMDAIRKSTGQQYLDNNGVISNDFYQIKVLYDNALLEQKALDLKLGVSLTKEQIDKLDKDIIWYVEKDIDGQKVMVPEIYLSKATRKNINKSTTGSSIIANNILLKGESIENSGSIFAYDFLSAEAKEFINESNWAYQASIGGEQINLNIGFLHNLSGMIGGGLTQINAGNLINETKVYQTIKNMPKNYSKESNYAFIASISGVNNLQLNIENDVANLGANLYSNKDITIFANNTLFDTIALTSKYEKSKNKYRLFGESNFTDSVETFVNLSSEIYSNGDLNIITKGDTTIIGSNLTSKDNANIFAGYKIDKDGNIIKSDKEASINILNAFNIQTETHKTNKKNYLGQFDEIKIDISKDKLNISTEGVIQTKTEYTKQTNVTLSSNINAGNINFNATNDINMTAVNIRSDKDTILNGKNINILSSENKILINKLNEEIKKKLSIEASHISLDINNLRKDFNKAKKDMENVQSSIKQLENKIKYIENNTTYSDLWKLKEIKELEEDIKEAKQLLDLSVLNFAKASYSLSMAIANLGTSISTLGFTGNIKGELSKHSDNLTSDIVNAIGSNIQSKGNIIVNADNIEQKGSELISSNGNILYNIAKDLIFSAVENKSNDNISSSNINIGFNIGNGSGISGYSNFNKAKETEEVLIYKNSTTTANNGSIIYNVGKNMTGIGYQAEGKNIIADIKGNMELVSLQNEFKLKGKSFGFGVNGSDSSAGFSLQNGKTNINRLWVDNISFIKGSESVDINIGENLSMKGSLIANIKDGIDMGNLSISANELIWEDIKNYFETKSQNISTETSVNYKFFEMNRDKNKAFKENEATTGLAFSLENNLIENIAKTTIGNGVKCK